MLYKSHGPHDELETCVELHGYVQQLEDAWNQGEGEQLLLTRFLPHETHPEFIQITTELLLVDFERRSELGLETDLAHYTGRLPSLQLWPEVMAALAEARHRILQAGVDQPLPDGAMTRVPESTGLCRRARDTGTSPLGQGQFPAVGETVDGFHLQSLLGAGTFSRVFLATQQNLGDRPVVVKFTAPTWGEPEKLARLQHPNVVPILSLHRAGVWQVICMPFVGTTTLHDLQRSAHATELRSEEHEAFCCSLVAQLADGLDHAHERGILHCDLKPANVLLASDGTPMLLDFNLASLVRRQGVESIVGGTLPYMAPEQIRSLSGATDAEVDQRADLYSLGVILAELLRGSRLFPEHAGEFQDSAAAALNDRASYAWDASWPSPVSLDVRSILRRCLAEDAHERYGAASELREDLLRHLADLPLRHAPNRSVTSRFHKWRRRNRIALSFSSMLAASLVLLLIVAGIAKWQHAKTLRLQAERQLAFLKSEMRDLRMGLGMPQVPPDVRATLRNRTAAIFGTYFDGAPARFLARADVRGLRNVDRAELESLLRELARRWWDDHQRLGSSGQPAVSPASEPWSSVLRWMQTGHPPTAGSHADFEKGLDLLRRARYAEAESVWLRHLDHYSTDAVAWFLLGNAVAGQERWWDAADHFSRSMALQPESPLPYFHRGICRLRTRRFQAAAEDFQRVLATMPVASARYNYALALFESGAHEDAVGELSHIVSDEPWCTRAWVLRSRCWQHLQDPARHEQDLTEARQSQPREAEDFIARALCFLPENPAGAAEDLQEALRVEPDSAAAWQNLAHVQAEHAHDVDAAQRATQEWLQRAPDSITARASLGVLEARRGETQRALDHLQSITPGPDDGLTCYQLASGYALLARQNPEYAQQAVDWLAQALNSDSSLFDTVVRDTDFQAMHDDPRLRKLLGGVQQLRAALPAQ